MCGVARMMNWTMPFFKEDYQDTAKFLGKYDWHLPAKRMVGDSLLGQIRQQCSHPHVCLSHNLSGGLQRGHEPKRQRLGPDNPYALFSLLSTGGARCSNGVPSKENTGLSFRGSSTVSSRFLSRPVTRVGNCQPELQLRFWNNYGIESGLSHST